MKLNTYCKIQENTHRQNQSEILEFKLFHFMIYNLNVFALKIHNFYSKKKKY